MDPHRQPQGVGDPPLSEMEQNNVLLITNAVEEVFFVLSRIKLEFRDPSKSEE